MLRVRTTGPRDFDLEDARADASETLRWHIRAWLTFSELDRISVLYNGVPLLDESSSTSQLEPRRIMPKVRRGRASARSLRQPHTTVGVVVFARHYRDAVLGALRRAPGIVAVDFGEGSAENIEQMESTRPDILIVDLPNHTLASFLRKAHAALPPTAILALNRGESEPELLSLFECGLTGFVAHDASGEEILDAIRSALRGEFTCTPRIAAALVRRVNAAGEPAKPPGAISALSPRELQIVRHLEQSMTNKEIAIRLGIETATVKNHVHNILRKLAIHRRVDAGLKLRLRDHVLRVVGRLPDSRER
jgi:DNA-binding NarL/FixJ family response regulator